MKLPSLILFNLLLNGVGSFAVGALLALAASRVLRASPGRALVWLWTLPFAKVVLDAAHGIPQTSFLWLRARGLSQDLGMLQIGVGLDHFIPKVQVMFGARLGAETYPQSGADLLASGLLKHVGEAAPAAVVALLVAGIARRLVIRGRALLDAIVEQRSLAARTPHEMRRVAGRTVSIYLLPDLEGSVFTGGFLRPFIAFPGYLWDALTPAEREAALQHELAHIAEAHLPWMLLTGLVSDLFWFVPFIDRVRVRLALACESAADARAVRRGADPVALASALVRTRELAGYLDRHAHSLGMARGALSARVTWLLAPRVPLSLTRLAARGLFVAWASAAVVVAVLFGNH